MGFGGLTALYKNDLTEYDLPCVSPSQGEFNRQGAIGAACTTVML